MKRILKQISDFVLNLLYPQKCPFCGRISPEGICSRCRKKIVYIRQPRCMHCGKPIRSEVEEYCVDCRKNPTNITQGRSLWLHRDPVASAVYGFKYRNKRPWGKLFAREMVREYGAQIGRWEIDEIIPVPLHASRRRKRGYNQAEIIAEEIAGMTGIPVRSDVLFRIRKTVAQERGGKSARAANLRGAFGVSRRWNTGGNVLLIYDNYTTGATVERASAILKKARAQNVYFLTISIGQGL